MEQQIPEQIASLLIPMIGRPMLLPNLAVAEIVTWEQPVKQDNSPDWLLGRISWRGEDLPIISLELMNDPETEDAHQGQRIAVINGMGNSNLPFYAVSVQGIPRLVRVFPEELGNEEMAENDKAYDMLVMVSGEKAVIPDLMAIENELNQVI